MSFILFFTFQHNHHYLIEKYKPYIILNTVQKAALK